MWSAGTRTPPRIGRAETWEHLLRRRESARKGLGGATLLESGAGLGKSTMLQAVVEDSRAHGFTAVLARAPPVEAPSAFKLLEEALELIATARLASTTSSKTATPGGSMAFLPAVGGPDELLSSSDPVRDTREGARSELAVDRIRLMTTLTEPFLSAAAEGPLLIGLDDLQWADEASVELVLYMLLQIEERPIWILASYDPHKARHASAEGPLTKLLRHPDVQRITLPPLTEHETAEFVRWAAPHRHFPDSELRKFFLESHGSPAELGRLLSPAEGAVPGGGSGSGSTHAADRLMSGLDPETRRLLTFAVVSGGEFSAPLLGVATGLGEDRAIELAERLQKLGLVRELDGGRFGFTEEEFRSHVYGRLLKLRARLIHRALLEALEETDAKDPASIYARARHSYLGQVDASAVHYNRQAAAQALATLDFGTALTSLERALETQLRVAPDDAAAEVELRLEIALAHSRLGRPAAAEMSLQMIRGSDRLWAATRPDQRTLLATYQARAMADQGKWDEAEKALESIPEELVAQGTTSSAIAAGRLRGEILYYEGKYAAALAVHESTREVARAAGERREASAETIRRAIVLSMLPGREAEALAEFRTAIADLLDLGDRAEAGYGQLCLGALLGEKGRPEEAREELLKAIEYAESAGDLRRSSWAFLNLADLEAKAGRERDALAHVRKARVEFHQVEDPLGEARANLTEGRLVLAAEDYDAAGRFFDTALGTFRGQHLEADELEVELRIAELAVAREQKEPARERLGRLVERGLPRLRPDLLDEWKRLGARVGLNLPNAG